MVKPRLREHPEDINRRGRPPGSRNKMSQLLRSLVLTAATMSGMPTKKWIIEEALDSEGRVQWVEDTDPKTGEPITDKKTGSTARRCGVTKCLNGPEHKVRWATCCSWHRKKEICSRGCSSLRSNSKRTPGATLLKGCTSPPWKNCVLNGSDAVCGQSISTR